MITEAPRRQSSRGAPTQAQVDLWNTMCQERGQDHLMVRHFPARYRYGDVNRMLDKLMGIPVLPGVVPAKPDPATKKATDPQIGYILRLQEQVGDEVGVPEDLLFSVARKMIDDLKARREKLGVC